VAASPLLMIVRLLCMLIYAKKLAGEAFVPKRA
jgi:hypothetical protein